MVILEVFPKSRVFKVYPRRDEGKQGKEDCLRIRGGYENDSFSTSKFFLVVFCSNWSTSLSSFILSFGKRTKACFGAKSRSIK